VVVYGLRHVTDGQLSLARALPPGWCVRTGSRWSGSSHAILRRGIRAG